MRPTVNATIRMLAPAFVPRPPTRRIAQDLQPLAVKPWSTTASVDRIAVRPDRMTVRRRSTTDTVGRCARRPDRHSRSNPTDASLERFSVNLRRPAPHPATETGYFRWAAGWGAGRCRLSVSEERSSQPTLRAHLDHCDDQPGLQRMAERIRRREGDNSAARPAHPPLRYRRDRQRKLALQDPGKKPSMKFGHADCQADIRLAAAKSVRRDLPAVGSQNHAHCLQHDDGVAREADGFGIVDVKRYPFGIGDFVAAAHLPQPSDAGTH